MTSPISAFNTPMSTNSLLGSLQGTSAASGQTPMFADMLLQQLGQVNALDQSAQSAVERSLSGGDVTQVEVLTEMKKADLALRMMIQVHNKIFDAYNEIKQMQM
ncbi:MAG TPA: flagellar hook-basal body complex protein FliE [Planctomycetaceae bacterium]|jgi:flagellar hook-basal body complex protein FliE|nr:flagellar hook-basal body complex protein FliE [Planctomycetaceae bacterium]